MAEEKKKSQVDDINRSIYDIKDKVEYSYKADNGLTEEVIREISAKKEEPEWMLEKRLQALKIYNHMDFQDRLRISPSSIWIISTPTSARRRI